MKKLLAIALVCVMAAALVVPMSAVSADPVNALYFNVAPTIDGAITEEEWGAVTVDVKPGAAAVYHTDASAKDTTAKVWIRWDDANFYLGVVAPDTDGHALLAGESSLWNGDVIQFGLDPAPIKFGGTAAATWSADFNNMAFGLVSDGNKLASWKWAGLDNGAAVKDAKFVVKYDSSAKQTTYEICIPFTSLAKTAPKAGSVWACSIVRLCASTGAYESWFTWGDGICGPQDDAVRVGANPVTFSADEAIIIEEVVEETEAPAADAPKTEGTTSAATADAGIVMFAAIAVISLAGALVVSKKTHR